MTLDPVQTDPDLYQVVLENERVRVLRYHDRPGQGTHPHHHPDSVMLTLSSFRRRLVNGDEHSEVTLESGQVRWLDAQEHSGHNIGSTDTVTVFVELKEPADTQGSARSSLGPRLG